MTQSSIKFRLSTTFLSALCLAFISNWSHAATYQAEDFTQTNGCKTATNHDGYNGSGFVDMGGQNSWFSSNKIQVASAGLYTLTFRYASRDNQNRRCSIIVNGTLVGDVDFAPTAAWNQWSTHTIDTTLEGGLNTVRVKATTTEGGPNIDAIDVTAKQTNYNQDPKAVIDAPSFSGNVGSPINMSGDDSYDPDGSIASYVWTFGDRSRSSLANPQHTYTTAGTYNITLMVIDNEGESDFATATATIYPNSSEFGAHGELNFAIVLLDYAGDGSAQPVDEIREGFFGGENSVANFIEQASYGKTTMTGDIFGWILPPDDLYGSAEQWSNCWPLDDDRFNILLDAYPETNLNNYDGFIFYVHRHPDSECHALGVSTTIGIEPVETYTSFGRILTRTSYVATDFYFPYQAYSRITDSTAAHEIVHSLGIMGHSLSYICDESALSTNPDDCYIQAYGDVFSIMGLRSQASHPNAVISERLGWLEDQSITTVSQAGQYTINSLEGEEQNVKAIKIPLEHPIEIGSNKKIDHIYVEYRGMTGFDARSEWFRNIPQQDGSTKRVESIHGALIRGADCTSNDYCVPYLLNMHPGSMDNASYQPNKVAQAYLYAGESFEVPLNKIEIHVLDVDPEHSIDIELLIEEAPPLEDCPNSVVIRAVPDPDVPSHVNWTASSTILSVNDTNSGFGCNTCTYSSSRLVYNISSSTAFDCPSEINLTAEAREGENLDGWEVNDSDPVPLSWTNTYNGVTYCSYSRYNFSHELMQCQ